MTQMNNVTQTTKQTVKIITLLLLIAAACAARGAGIGPWHFGHSQQFLEIKTISLIVNLGNHYYFNKYLVSSYHFNLPINNKNINTTIRK